MSESGEKVSNDSLGEELGRGKRSAGRGRSGRTQWDGYCAIVSPLSVSSSPFCCLFPLSSGPYIAPYSYTEQDLLNVAKMPSPDHWLGTDEIGRDLFSRVLWGARTATLVAIFTTFISVIIGVIIGAIAGYGGALADNITGRIIDIVMSVPGSASGGADRRFNQGAGCFVG